MKIKRFSIKILTKEEIRYNRMRSSVQEEKNESKKTKIESKSFVQPTKRTN